MAQLDMPVGDIHGNARRIREAVVQARDRHGADLVVFPELAIAGYPPEDLLLRPGFVRHAGEALESLAAEVRGIEAVIGFPERDGDTLYNSCAWVADGRVQAVYRKSALPNYAVFDEKRYFQGADQPLVRECAGQRVGVVICEDLWEREPVARCAEAGARIIVSPNASPYALGKRRERRELVSGLARQHGVSMIYCNLVGGQDELVFDGGDFAASPDGASTGQAPACEEGLFAVQWDAGAGWRRLGWEPAGEGDEDAEVWTVLSRGLRDYVDKNGFPGVLLGLSGGIDSALVATLAADALGAERVGCVTMPARYTADISTEDAEALANNLGIRVRKLPVDGVFQSFLDLLEPAFGDREPDVTEENLQARIRGTILMALSNKFGDLLLATGNKSELAVGYATLYGDMNGGFAPIKDCYKTRVYRLAQWRNGRSPAIPGRIIQRPPSAELAADQTDQDSLPPYDELDAILERYIERTQSVREIAAAGFDEGTVRRVASMVLKSEYKRRQGAPGPRITPCAFGRDRRYPITSGWREDA